MHPLYINPRRFFVLFHSKTLLLRQPHFNSNNHIFKISPSFLLSHTNKTLLHKSFLYPSLALFTKRIVSYYTRDTMKNRSSGFLKQFIAGLSSMAKSKTLALKSKTNSIRARLIIFSLLMNKKFVMSSISHKFQSVLGHHSHSKEECLLEDSSDQNKAMMVFNDNAHSYEAVSNPSETQVVVEERDQDGYESYYRYGEDDDYDDGDGDGECKYPDLTHTLFDSEDLDLGGSVIDLVKNSKEEAGQEFKMEEEIDYMADLFIKKFHRQIFLQKQDSLKRCQEMLLSGDA